MVYAVCWGQFINLGQTLHSATFSLDLCVHLEKIISNGGEFTGGQKIEVIFEFLLEDIFSKPDTKEGF